MNESWSMRLPDESLNLKDSSSADLEQKRDCLELSSKRSTADITPSQVSEGDSFLGFYASFIGASPDDKLAWHTESFGQSSKV